MKKARSKTLATAILALAALSGRHIAAQTTPVPTVISSTNASTTLNAASDNYEIHAGSFLAAGSGNGVIIGGGATSPWHVKNAGSVSHAANSGMYFSYDAVVTNLVSGVISSTSASASHAGVYFTAAAGGVVENSGTILGGLKGVNFGNTSRTNTVVNNAGALIRTFVNATNGGAIYSASNNMADVTNAGYIWGALRGLHFGGASTVVNTGTIRGDSGIAIMFNSTAASSTITFGAGSEIIGNAVSNAGLLNHIILAGSGSEDDSFIGFDGDATRGFSTLTMDGADWTLSGTVHLTNATADALTVTAGRLSLFGDTILATAGGAVTIVSGGTLQIGNNSVEGSLVNLTLGAGVMPDIVNDGALVISRSDDITLTNAISGGGRIVQAGGGVLALTGGNTHAGGVRVDSGTLAITDDASLGNVTGALTLNGGVVRYDAALTSARALELAAGGIIDTNGNAITLAGSVSGPGDLIKTGAGFLELTGANTSAGATHILSGTLQGNIGGGLLTVGTGATYKVAAGTTDAVLGNIAGAGDVDLNNANLVFNVTSGTQIYGFVGTLQNGGNLVKTGVGKLDIGSHSFAGEISATGTTFVEEGTLKFDALSQIGPNLVLGGGAITGIIETDFSAWTQNLNLVGAGGGISIASGSQALAIAVAGDGDFVKAGAGTLDITAATMAQGGNTQIHEGKLIASLATLIGSADIAAGAILELNQPVSGTYSGAISGGGALVKNGAGELVLAGANTCTGDTTINEGTLGGNIGKGTLTVNSGATYNADGATDFSLSGILGSGTIHLNTADLAFNVASGTGFFNFSGVLTGGNQLIKTGAGVIELQTAAVLSNGVAVKDGILKLADQNYVNAPITLGDTATSGMIEYTGATAWNRALSLAGAGGGFTVSSGTQALAAGVAISGAGDFVKGGDGALDITAASMTNTGNTRIDAGKLIASTDTAKGNVILAAGATLEFIQNTNGIYGGIISGSGSLIKSGSSEVILTGANTYGGDTTINEGTLSGNIGQGMLTVNSGATYKVADGVTDFSLSGILGSGTVNLNAANLSINVAGDISVFNFNGALTGGNQLIKTGAGVIELQTAAVLSNGVAVKDGVLKLADQNYVNAPITLGDTATSGMIEYTGSGNWGKNIVLAGAGGGFVVDSGTLTLAPLEITGNGNFIKTGGGTLDITAAGMLSTGGNTLVQGGRLIGTGDTIKGNATLSAGTTLEFNQAAAGTYTGNITGDGSLVKTGDGILALTGANTQTGGISILGGALAGNVSSLQGDITTADSTTVIFDQATDATYAAAVIGSGSLVKTGGGKLTLTGSNRHTGGTQILAGAIEANTATLSGNITNNATLIFNQSTAGTYAGVIGGTGQLQKAGGGVLTLSGANTYSGATLITQGVFRASAPGRLSAASQHIVFGDLATLDLGGYEQTIAGLVNTGTVILDATINPDAGVIITANRLNINGDASGDGKLLIRVTEDSNAGAGAGTTQRVLVKIGGANTAAYTGELDRRYVNGAYEWSVVPGADGQSFDLKFGQLSPEVPAAASIPAIAQFMAKAGIDTLSQRLGDMRGGAAGNTGLWFRGIYREDRVENSILDGMKNRTVGGQAGAVWSCNEILTPKGRLDFGVLLTMVEADARFQKSADLDGNSEELGFFATCQLDGWYADLMLNMAYSRYKLRMRDGTDTLKLKGRNPTAILEIGKRLDTRLGTIEPQIQAAYQYCQINEHTDAFNRDYTFDSTNMLNAHAGLRWHKVYAKAGSSNAFVPALRVRYGYEYLGESKVRVAGTEFKNELRGSQLSADAGFSWWFNRHAGVYANVEWASGNAHNSLSATTGIRVSW